MLIVLCVVTKRKVLKACLGTLLEVTLTYFEKKKAAFPEKQQSKQTKHFSLANPTFGEPGYDGHCISAHHNPGSPMLVTGHTER